MEDRSAFHWFTPKVLAVAGGKGEAGIHQKAASFMKLLQLEINSASMLYLSMESIHLGYLSQR